MNKSKEDILIHAFKNDLENDRNMESYTHLFKNESFNSPYLKGIQKFLNDHAYDYSQLKQFLQSSKKNIQLQPVDSSLQNRQNLLKAAAVLAIIIAVGTTIYFFTSGNNKSNDDLYAKYYEKDIGTPVTLSSNEEKLKQETMNYFKAGEYKKAEQGFLKLLQSSSEESSFYHYYLGCTYLELKQWSDAKKHLKSVDSKQILIEKVEYRLALTYLMLEDTDAALDIMKKIVQNKDHRYRKEAEQFLQEF